jgi:hypothetical protein
MKCAALVTLLLLCNVALGQNSSALINEALDKQVKLDIDTVLPQAMKQISDQTGVSLRADPSVWDLLPWGQQTNITAKIENQTLREALEALTRKLGLTFVLREAYVEIEPMPALARLGRRSTVQELQALDLLTSTPLNLGLDRPTIKQIADAVDAKLVELKSPFAVEDRVLVAQQDQVVTVPRNATMADALEAIANTTTVTWYPWGKSIVLLGKEEQTRAQLNKTISTRYNGVDVTQVLMELSRYAGVPFSVEPGAVQRIPPEFRTIRLILDNATIQQVLENLCGFTGLAYVVNDKGVYIWNQSASPAPGARDPIVGLVPLDNGMQMAVTESQVPPDVKEYLKAKRQKWLDNVRSQMKEEGFKPATKPATTREDL